MAKKDIKTKEIEGLKNQLARALADYQNLERRAKEERKEWIKTANKELLLRLLPVLDTLMLAAKHSPDEGVELSVQQFLNVLKTEGVEKIQTVGQSFDPKMMECVDTKEGEEEKVLEEVQIGYTLNGELLRPAGVRVGKSATSELTSSV